MSYGDHDHAETATALAGVEVSTRLVIGLFAAIDAHDWSALPAFLHPEIIYERPGYAPCVGLGDVIRFYTDIRIIDTGAHEIEHVVADADHGACWGRFRGRARDGRALDELFSDVYTFAGSKIRMRRSHFFRPAI